MPNMWPKINANELQGLSYPALAAQVIKLFTTGWRFNNEVLDMCEKAYSTFDHTEVTPLVNIRDDLWVMELFHGPTLAFKDVAMQLLGHFLSRVLAQDNKKATIVVATSGDTGSAAIEAYKDKKNINLVVLYPSGRISEVQRQQMSTILSRNVLSIAVEGSFDDCQDIVKVMFGDKIFSNEVHLTSVNSINWGRIVAQIPYYVAASLKLSRAGCPVDFSVPTGNFGNVFAAWIARRIGAPIGQIIVASNKNDILTRFFSKNDMSIRVVEPSLSPSMDIQVSSNFERFLFNVLDCDGEKTSDVMKSFRKEMRMHISNEKWMNAAREFIGHSLNDADAIKTMTELSSMGYISEPHTATAAAAKHLCRPGVPMVIASTAHPAKFPDAVENATGEYPLLPDHLANLPHLPEHIVTLPANAEMIKSRVRDLLESNS